MMKQTFFIFGLLMLSIVGRAQTAYDQDIKTLIEARLKQYDKDTENVKHAHAIFSQFNKAKKAGPEQYRKQNVGIGLVLSPDDFDSQNPSPIVAPAAYNHEDSQIGIAAVRNSKTKGSNPKLAAYGTTYIYDFENIFSDPTMEFLASNAVPAYGEVSENNTEIIVSEEGTLSFIRTDLDWLYIVSIDENFEYLDVPRIILYAFRIKFDGKDIFKESKSAEKVRAIAAKNNNTLTKVENRLYHDRATNALIGYVATISELKPYAQDSELQKYKAALPSALDRDNVALHEETLRYFSDTFQLTPEHQKEYLDSYGSERDLLNINHMASHALADVYMTQEKYSEAIVYFNKAQQIHPYVQSSGTTINKDYLRIQNDLVEAYHKSDQNNMAIAHALNMMMNGQSSAKSIHDKLVEYSKNEDAKRLLDDIDAIGDTMTAHPEYAYTSAYVFRKNKVTFKPYFGSAKKEFSRITESDFYKDLKTKAASRSEDEPSRPQKKDTHPTDAKPYHDGELKNLEASLIRLMQTEQFKDDAKLKSNVDSYRNKYKPQEIADLIDEFKYFYNNIYVVGDMVKNMTEQEAAGLQNIRHIAGHSLSDYYIKVGKYNDALIYLLLLESQFLFEQPNRDGEDKDRQQIRSDLATVYLAMKTEEATLSYLLAIFLDGGHLADYADKKMATVTEAMDTEDLKTFRNQFFETLKMPDDTHYNFRMGYFYPRLELAEPMKLEALKKKVKTANLFKRL